MELRYDREQERDDGCDDDERDSDDAQVIRVVSRRFGSEHVDDELHIDIREHGADIDGKQNPQGISENFHEELLLKHDFDSSEIDPIELLIEKHVTEQDSHEESEDPIPCIVDQGTMSGKMECVGYGKDGEHSHEFGSFLGLRILRSSEDGIDDHEEIQSYEKQRKNPQYRGCFGRMEIASRNEIRPMIQCPSDQQACRHLNHRGIGDDRFQSRVILFDDVFREEVIKRFGESEIMIDRKERHQADHSIENPDLRYGQIVREDDLDDVSDRSRQEGEEIEPSTPLDQLFAQSLF